MAFHKPYKTNKGYVMEYHPDHPRANNRGYVMQHIIAYEKHTGTMVQEGFAVHHINGLKGDNRPENLALMTVGEHSTMHNLLRTHSEKTKSKLSIKAKERLSDPTKHPRYLPLDIEAIRADRDSGMDVKHICQKYGISKYTYYTRTTNYRREK
jgi:hypothetical protein